jgi:outer membrane protein assembly factor BamA
MTRWLAAACLLWSGLLVASDQPSPVVAVYIKGNEVTQLHVLRRELRWREGSTPTEEQLEDDRQALLDLGLFRSVELTVQRTAQGKVLTYAVREKFYLLPVPRLSANADGRYSYGAQVRWSNVFGLNHSLVVYGERENTEEPGVGEETQYAISYVAPALTGRYETLVVGMGHTTRPVLDGAGGKAYDERIDTAAVTWLRQLTPGRSNQGWSVGLGPRWRRQDTLGPSAPPEDGHAAALGTVLAYRNQRFRVYSDEGLRFNMHLDAAREGWIADYDFVHWGGEVAWLRPFGNTPHQSLHLFAELGGYHGGPASIDAYSLGGGGQLRAYDRAFIEGDAYYRLAVEWLRPLHWPWLRVLVVLENGNVFDDVRGMTLRDSYTSLGLGLRLRVPQFVNLEVEVGWAFPLGDGGEGQVFGGRP